MKIKQIPVDVKIENHGTVLLFRLLTLRAREWVKDNLDIPGYSWMGANSFGVDWAQAQIVAAIMEEHEDGGLKIR